jgi:hypothetical protein
MPYRSAPRHVDVIRRASPCSTPWEEMLGDERVRVCGACTRTVYNVQAMSPATAEELIAQDRSGCVRLFRRSDGKVLAADCPVGARRKRVAWALTAAALVGAGVAAVEVVTRHEREIPRHVHQGNASVMTTGSHNCCPDCGGCDDCGWDPRQDVEPLDPWWYLAP